MESFCPDGPHRRAVGGGLIGVMAHERLHLLTSPMHRTRALTVLAVLFGLFTLNAWTEALLSLFGRSDEPRSLTALQVAVGVAGAFATRGTWTGAHWAPVAVLAYGSITGAMLVALPLILGLEPEARRGIWAGAASAVLFSAGVAWYLRRVVREKSSARR
jgi:hypothetical protein